MKRAIFLLVHFIRQLFQIHFQIFVHNKPPLFLRSAAQRNGARQPGPVRHPAATYSGSVLPLRMEAAAPSESSAKPQQSKRPRVQTHSKAARFPAQQQSCAQQGFHGHQQPPPGERRPGRDARARGELDSRCFPLRLPRSGRASVSAGTPGRGLLGGAAARLASPGRRVPGYGSPQPSRCPLAGAGSSALVGPPPRFKSRRACCSLSGGGWPRSGAAGPLWGPCGRGVRRGGPAPPVGLAVAAAWFPAALAWWFRGLRPAGGLGLQGPRRPPAWGPVLLRPGSPPGSLLRRVPSAPVLCQRALCF